MDEKKWLLVVIRRYVKPIMINASTAALGTRSATISVPPTTAAASVSSFWNDKSSVSNLFARSNQWRGGKIMRGILIVLTLVLATLVAPIRSYAQSDQVIILACTSTAYPAYRETLTVDLTKKTVARSSAPTLENDETNFG
jgi:hypothetical protein